MILLLTTISFAAPVGLPPMLGDTVSAVELANSGWSCQYERDAAVSVCNRQDYAPQQPYLIDQVVMFDARSVVVASGISISSLEPFGASDPASLVSKTFHEKYENAGWEWAELGPGGMGSATKPGQDMATWFLLSEESGGVHKVAFIINLPSS